MSERVKYTADDIFHHSRLSRCRTPFGAVKTGSLVVLRVDVSEQLKDAFCLVSVTYDGMERTIEMNRAVAVDGRSCFETQLQLPRAYTGTAWYYFIINDGKQLTYCGNGGMAGRGVVTDTLPQPYQITVYDADYKTPDWFKQGILYQIFVDRFSRGGENGGLARTAERIKMGRDTTIHANWNDMPVYQPAYGRKDYEPCDFFGGDLLGIVGKLDYLASLGVGCIYLNPVFEANSNHKYDTGDYMRIDPMYGDDEIFKELCAEAKKRGISIMLDGVFSHTGADSRYFNRYGRYSSKGAYQSPESPYYGWYDFTRYPDAYRCWWGFESLPEVQENAPTYRQFILTCEDSVIKHWMRMGIKGWRLDVADELPDDFIALMRSVIKEQDEEAVLLGEVWEDASNKKSMGVDRQYVMGKELDSVMNYPQRGIIIGFLLNRLGAFSATMQLNALRENYPPEFYEACMNLLSTHDMPRVLSLLGGAPDKDAGLSREQQALFSLTEEQHKNGLARLKLATLLQFALPGVPCIYYGDEAGLLGLMDPFNRATYPWGKEHLETLHWHKMLSSLRKEAFFAGRTVLLSSGEDVLCVVRFDDEGKAVIALVNRSLSWTRMARLELGGCGSTANIPACLPVEGPDADALSAIEVDGRYKDLLGSDLMAQCVDRVFSVVLPPLCAALFARIAEA